MSAAETLDARGARRARRELALVIVPTLLVQAIALYGHPYLKLWGGFYYATFAGRLLLPLLCGLLLLRIPLRDQGLRWPRLAPRQWLALLTLFALLPLAAIPLLELDAYRAAYASQRGASGALGPKLAWFALFTLSTTIPWEILHRGFLLHATREVLSRAGAAAVAPAVAIGLTLSFEVLYHLSKPPLEALAMAIASPFLSWLALRSRSILLPLLLHLQVEALYFARVLV